MSRRHPLEGRLCVYRQKYYKWENIEDVAQMVLTATGANGTYLQYVHGISKELFKLGIEDYAVIELLRAIVAKHKDS